MSFNPANAQNSKYFARGNLDDISTGSLMKRWLNEEISDVQTGAFLSALERFTRC